MTTLPITDWHLEPADEMFPAMERAALVVPPGEWEMQRSYCGSPWHHYRAEHGGKVTRLIRVAGVGMEYRLQPARNVNGYGVPHIPDFLSCTTCGHGCTFAPQFIAVRADGLHAQGICDQCRVQRDWFRQHAPAPSPGRAVAAAPPHSIRAG